MKTKLTINKEIDRLFHDKCQELSIYPTCIAEYENNNRYELVYKYDHDLFYLGMAIGLEKSRQIYTTERKTHWSSANGV